MLRGLCCTLLGYLFPNIFYRDNQTDEGVSSVLGYSFYGVEDRSTREHEGGRIFKLGENKLDRDDSVPTSKHVLEFSAKIA